MIPIYPVTAENVTPFVGVPVMAMTVDGKCYCGVLGGINGNKLILRDFPEGQAAQISTSLKLQQTKKSKKERHKKKKAVINRLSGPFFGVPPFGFGVFPFFFGAAALVLGAIALLVAFI